MLVEDELLFGSTVMGHPAILGESCSPLWLERSCTPGMRNDADATSPAASSLDHSDWPGEPMTSRACDGPAAETMQTNAARAQRNNAAGLDHLGTTRHFPAVCTGTLMETPSDCASRNRRLNAVPAGPLVIAGIRRGTDSDLALTRELPSTPTNTRCPTQPDVPHTLA